MKGDENALLHPASIIRSNPALRACVCAPHGRALVEKVEDIRAGSSNYVERNLLFHRFRNLIFVLFCIFWGEFASREGTFERMIIKKTRSISTV